MNIFTLGSTWLYLSFYYVFFYQKKQNSLFHLLTMLSSGLMPTRGKVAHYNELSWTTKYTLLQTRHKDPPPIWNFALPYTSKITWLWFFMFFSSIIYQCQGMMFFKSSQSLRPHFLPTHPRRVFFSFLIKAIPIHQFPWGLVECVRRWQSFQVPAFKQFWKNKPGILRWKLKKHPGSTHMLKQTKAL